MAQADYTAPSSGEPPQAPPQPPQMPPQRPQMPPQPPQMPPQRPQMPPQYYPYPPSSAPYAPPAEATSPAAPESPYGAPPNPSPSNPYGGYGGYAPPSGYGAYGRYAPPSGYGQPQPYSQPYGQPQPYSQPLPGGYPIAPGYPPGYAPPSYPLPRLAPLPERKRRTGLIVTIVALVVVVLAACTGGMFLLARSVNQTTIGNIPGSGTPGASQTPAASSTPVLVYGDTFKSNATGWANDPGHCFLGSDGYHTVGGYLCYAPAGTQTDVILSVTVQQVSGPTTTSYGIDFRHASKGNDYLFLIDSNSQWLFLKCVDGACSNSSTYTPNAAIKGGLNTANTLQVIASGPHFEFSVNGTRVGGVDDSTFDVGRVGIAGGDSADCTFTNFLVYNPQ